MKIKQIVFPTFEEFNDKKELDVFHEWFNFIFTLADRQIEISKRKDCCVLAIRLVSDGDNYFSDVSIKYTFAIYDEKSYIKACNKFQKEFEKYIIKNFMEN